MQYIFYTYDISCVQLNRLSPLLGDLFFLSHTQKETDNKLILSRYLSTVFFKH